MCLGQGCVGCQSIIEVVPNHVYLGLIVDNNFSWRPHIDSVCSKLRCCAFKLYNLKFVLPFNLLRTVYSALVESIIAYGIISYGNASFTHLSKIESLQSKIIKTITPHHVKSTLDYDLTKMYQRSNFLPINHLFIYKFILKFYFHTQFKVKIDHNINTRLSEHNFKIPEFKNKYGKRRLEYSVPSIFNGIPNSLKSFDKYSYVKKEIKSWLIRNINLLV
jgi:hypothetical protein